MSQSINPASPWIDSNSALDDLLVAQLAADLGGNPTPPADVPQSVVNVAAMPGLPIGVLAPQHSSLPQQHLAAPLGLHSSWTASLGSAPDGSLGAVLESMQQAQQLQQPVLTFRPAFGANGLMMAPAAAAAAAAAGQLQGVTGHDAAASKSQSPSNSSGCHAVGGDEGAEQQGELRHTAHKAINKGALAQKRFRERQKEKMRANEVQVAELTRRLGELEMEKARLQSRTRLLEQVVSLNFAHEAKLHTNREIMVREQEMLLEDLAHFVLQLASTAAVAAAAAAAHGGSSSSSPSTSPDWLQGLPGLGVPSQLDVLSTLLQQQLGPQQQQQQLGLQQQQQLQQDDAAQAPHSLMQVIRGWTVQVMVDVVFAQYIACLQQLLPCINTSSFASGSSGGGSSGSNAAAAAAAQQQVEALVLARRDMLDRHALFSHFYWAVWCFNRGDMAAAGLVPPAAQHWVHVVEGLHLSKAQVQAIVAARTALLAELHRVAGDWQRVLPTLALQLLQVPRSQWHTVEAVQAMVTNLAAEREAVVGFLHTLLDEVLTPVQEGQLEAASYPWCPDVWAIAGVAAAQAAASSSNTGSADAGSGAGGSGSSGRGKGGRNGRRGPAASSSSSALQQPQQQQQGPLGPGLSTSQVSLHQLQGGLVLDEDPMAALAVGTDVLQPLMPFMTAFQLLREPMTAKGAGLRLKRALLLDPFRTVVPAAAYSQPTAAEVSAMSLLDAHCGTFQQVMLWTWLQANLPSYVTMLGMQPNSSAAAAVGLRPQP